MDNIKDTIVSTNAINFIENQEILDNNNNIKDTIVSINAINFIENQEILDNNYNFIFYQETSIEFFHFKICIFVAKNMSTLEIINKNNVTYLNLNRPEKFNSFNREMAIALQNALRQSENDDNCRCVVISGNGKAFCAGQDLSEAIDPNGPGILNIVTQHYNPIIKLIREIKKPVISAVNGVAAGAGANIAFCCDIVLASDSASFIQAFSKIGLIPDSGGTYFLPRLLGLQRASALMMTGDKISAKEAQDMGLVYKVFSVDNFKTDVEKFAENIAQMPTQALVSTKILLNKSFNNTLENQLELEAQYQNELSISYDYREGVNAFLEKRQAKFIGK
jgi:2-(1,2-epoxy-1,2-dihydrophenyl)acetyl-CoA isomerase